MYYEAKSRALYCVHVGLFLRPREYFSSSMFVSCEERSLIIVQVRSGWHAESDDIRPRYCMPFLLPEVPKMMLPHLLTGPRRICRSVNWSRSFTRSTRLLGLGQRVCLSDAAETKEEAMAALLK